MLKGHLDVLVLAVLESRPRHGYAVVEALRGRTSGLLDVAEGTLYPLLHRLEKQGALASRWQVAAGRRRRVYRLTPRGRAALAEGRREWTDFSGAVQSILEPSG